MSRVSKPDKVLVWSEIQERAHSFVKQWEGETSERAESQTFWNEFFAVFGVKRRAVARFEERARRVSTGGTGRIDVFWPKVVAVEHKSAGASLGGAEEQLADYDIPISLTPQLHVVSDFARFAVWDLESGERAEFQLGELPSRLRLFAPIAGYRKRAFREEEAASREAAELLGRLHDHLADSGYGGHQLRVLVVRLLFCLFADDTLVWRSGLFDDFLEYRTSEDGSDLGPQLVLLFQTLNQRVEDRQSNLDSELASFPYINGGLFAEALTTPFFDAAGREMLLAASRFDWKAVSPIVFGSLFQSVKGRSARRELGEHYTPESSILKLLDPLFLEGLRGELEAAGGSRAALERLHLKIASIKVLDPACGCGNFLAVAYRELRRLETEILARMYGVEGELHVGQTEFQRVIDIGEYTRVSVRQFFGIELEEFPAQIAQAAMYLSDHLENMALAARFGQYYARFPIQEEATIVEGNALALDWSGVVSSEEVDYVVGNPPFRGHKYRSQEQSSDLKRLWGRDYNKLLDYVTGWYRKAMDYGRSGDVAFAFVSTNSIAQGEQVAYLWGPMLKAGFHLEFACTSFPWVSEARGQAQVHVVIEAFVHGDRERRKWLIESSEVAGGERVIEVGELSPYLVEGPELVVEKRRSPLSSLMPSVAYGALPSDGGGLVLSDLPADDAVAMKYVRPFIGSKQLTQGEGRWCLWMPNGPDPGDVGRSELLRDRLARVRKWRAGRENPDTAALSETPYRFFHVVEPPSGFIGFPAQVTNARRWYTVAYLEQGVIPSNTLYYAEDAEGFAFSVVSSSMFMAWLRLVGGRIKSDPRFGTAAYNSFPLPDELGSSKRRELVECGARLRAARAGVGESSLAQIYDADSVPRAVVDAHTAIDRALDSVFVPRRRNWSEGVRQQCLLEAYEAMAAGE